MKSFTIHSRLSMLVLLTAVPLLTFAVGLVFWSSKTEQDLLRQNASSTADASMQAIDRELSGAIRALQVLAASPAMAQQDFKGLHAQASAAVGLVGDSVIILYDRLGNRIISTAAAYGTPLAPRRNMAMIGRPFQTGEPHVTHLFMSETVKAPTVGVVVPVKVEGEVRYVLGAGLLSQRLSELLLTSGLPDGWVAAVLDEDGTIIGRTRNQAEFIGQKALPDVWQRMQAVKGPAGTVDGLTKEGDPVVLTFARSNASGWMTVVGIPTPVLQGPLQASLALVATAAAFMLLLATLLAWWAARQISQPAARLQEAARALEEGTRVHPLSATGIQEFDKLAVAVENASSKILEREGKLKDSLERLDEAHRELRDDQQKKDQFIATLAHELRNPLAPIRMGVHVLRKSPPVQVASKTLSMMDRQVSHLVRLVDDLLDVSRIARGKLVLQKEDVALQTVISSAAEAVEPNFHASGQKLRVEVPETPVWVNADPDRLAQVITNVLNNAGKFSPPGQAITLSLASDSQQAEIRISDDGIGIPPDKLEEIFEPFSQIDEDGNSGRQAGLGIGLSLSRQLVQLHGGAISARSEGRGHGATVLIRLPGARRKESESDDVTPLHRPKGGSAWRVLVVDDNVDAADLLATALRISGHSACVAHDGLTALQMAAESDFDVVMLDIGMPGMDGYEVCRRLRQYPRYRRTKIVALTGWGADADRRQSKEAGFDAHLAKPVGWDQIEQVLQDVPVRDPGSARALGD